MQLLASFSSVRRKSFLALVPENCQQTELEVLGQHLHQRYTVASGKRSLCKYLLSLTSLLQVLQEAQPFSWDLFPGSVLLNTGRIYVPYFCTLIRTRYFLSCAFTALLVQMSASAGVQLKEHRLCITKIRCP